MREAQRRGLEGLPEARGQQSPTGPGAATSGSSTRTCRANRRGTSGSRPTRSSSSTTRGSPSRGGRRDVLRRLRDGARGRPRGAVARARRRGPRGVPRPGHVQLRQVPGGPPHLVGRGRRHRLVGLLPDRGRGRSTSTASSAWSPARTSRSSSWRPAARAASGSAARPNDWTLAGAPSGDEQAAYYEEMFEACARRPGSAASCSGTGRPSSTQRPAQRMDDDYCMHGKPGAKVVTVAYQRMRQV